MTVRIPDIQVFLLGIISNLAHSKLTNNDTHIEDTIESYIFYASGYRFKLQAPASSSMEDIMKTVAVLLIILVMIAIWYSITRTLLYLAYSKADRTKSYP